MTMDPFAASEKADKDAAAFLAGAGGIISKWPVVGHVNEGTIIGWSAPVQKTKMGTNELMAWPDGRPRMQLPLEVQEEPTGFYWKWDEDNEVHVKEALDDDDGIRLWYVSGGLHIAIQKAIRSAKSGLEKGAYVQAKRLANAKAKKGFKAAHQFTALWTPAAQNPRAGAGSFLSGGDDPFGASAPADDDTPF